MKFQFLTPTIHGLLDYAAAGALIVLPFLLGLEATSPTALWLSVAGGIGLIAYSLATDYAFGAVGIVSFRVHLILDLLAAVAFAIAPFAFGWRGLTLAYYLAMAAGVLVVVALSDARQLTTESAVSS